MLKKIEIFMSVMLALCAVLILMATGSRKPPESTPETTSSTVQTTAPETQPEAPSENDDPPMAPPAEQSAVSRVRSQVEQILDSARLDKTAATRRAVNGALNASEHTAGKAEESCGYALAEILEDRQVNPVAAFWKLVHGGLYEKQTDSSGELSVAGLRTPEQTAKEYAYSDEGAQQLLTDLLNLAAQMEDDLELELALLGANLTVESDQVSFSDREQCRYAYFSCASDRATYILCFYFRGIQQIEDVEFQLLYLRHASGETEDLAVMDYNARKQAAALMAASELLMTGRSKAGEGLIPFSYDVGGAAASLERFEFTGTPDRGSLINYRLKLK